MTRETKIGMLVGLGVIVLIGVLLSEYLGNSGPGQQAVDLDKYRGAEYRANVIKDVGVPSVKGIKPGTGEPVVAEDPQAAMAFSDNGNGGPKVGPAVAVEPVGMIPADGAEGMGTPVLLADGGHHADAGPAIVAGPRVVNREYVILKNDTVKSLAKKFYNTTAAPEIAGLVAANPGVLKDGNTPLVAGKKLMIPLLESPAAPAVVVAGPAAQVGAMKTYMVVKGDTISTIAKKTLGTGGPIATGEILKANGLKDGAMIREGTVLKIPAKTGGAR